MMNNFVILYSGGRMAESETEQKQVMQAWEDWFGKVGKGLVDAGNPFSSKAKSISSDGKVMDDSDGCMPSGYSIIQAESLDAAVALARDCPVLRDGAQISVYETFNTMGM
jgi:hypothetical protein